MSLIKVNDLVEAMYHEAFEVDSDMQKWDSGCWIRYKLFENVLSKVKRIHIEPNSNRVKLEPFFKESNNTWYCKNCKHAVSIVQNFVKTAENL